MAGGDAPLVEPPEFTSRRYLLELARDALVAAIPPRYDKDLPPLVRELRMILAELDGLPDSAVKTPADEIAERRARRRAKASGE